MKKITLALLMALGHAFGASAQDIPRVMVVEEGTGSWCGWCVRGIVAMKEMQKKYPERFIGIAVHNGDEYVVPNYISWLVEYSNSYPFCIINRSKEIVDPSPENLEKYYQALTEPAEASLTVHGYYDEDTKNITFVSEAQFVNDVENAQYRFAFVLTEDNLPILQSNYYSGGEYGEMGGFEELGSTVAINVDHVARGVWPNAKGAPNSIPETIVKGETYSYSYKTKMPTVKNIDNLIVIALLIDYKTKAILQAAKTEGLEDIVGIHTVSSPEHRDKMIYDLTGRRTNGNGIVIEDGKLRIRN